MATGMSPEAVEQRMEMLKQIKDAGFLPQIMLYAHKDGRFLWLPSPEIHFNGSQMCFALLRELLKIPGLLPTQQMQGQVVPVPPEFINSLRTQDG